MTKTIQTIQTHFGSFWPFFGHLSSPAQAWRQGRASHFPKFIAASLLDAPFCMFRFANDDAKQWRTVWLAATQQVVGLLAQFGFGCHMLPLLSTNRKPRQPFAGKGRAADSFQVNACKCMRATCPA